MNKLKNNSSLQTLTPVHFLSDSKKISKDINEKMYLLFFEIYCQQFMECSDKDRAV